MKKFLSLLLCILFLTTGCDSDATSSISGTVQDFDFDLAQFQIKADTGETYTFCVDEETTFILQYEGGSRIKRQGTEYMCEFLWYNAPIQVIPGEEVLPKESDYFDSNLYYTVKEATIGPISPTLVTEAKPVIYLYPETEMNISIKLNYDGRLTCTYPKYENGWTVTAAPDGTLTDAEGKTYNYLYWEGETNTEYDFSKGFCIAGEDTALFLEDALAKLGLTRREANEFIVYWLPRMECNAYNLISFQTNAYTDHAELTISPAPDTLIRVFMAFTPLDKFVEIEPQVLAAPDRQGFTVIEWGGCQIN